MIDIKKEIEARKESILKDLVAFINIDTVYDHDSVTEQTPYGKGVANGFAYVKSLAQRDNFKYEEFDGRICHIEFGDKNAKLVSVLGHLDTVPYSKVDWKAEPLSGQIIDGEIYGRGTQDDKGPMISCYYALKIIKELNLPIKHKLRIIFGGDEERGSSCIKHYNNIVTENPIISFTPDSDFPLICAEKQMLQVKGEMKYHSPIIVKLETSNKTFNVVPDKATAIIKSTLSEVENAINAFGKKENISFVAKDINDGTVQIISKGLAAHGSIPHTGCNAFTHLMALIASFSNDQLAKFIVDNFHEHFTGKTINVEGYDEFEGYSSVSFNVAKLENDVFTFLLDTRHPNNVDIEKTKATFVKIFNTGFVSVVDFNFHKGLYFDPKSKPISFLLDSYKEITGDKDAKPLAIGGGTYAKNYPNCVAYGMMFPETIPTLHNKNERVKLSEFWKATEIYVHTIYKLLTNY